MSLSRRTFLRLALSGVAGTLASQELDWDRLLWVPGRKTIFIPNNPTISVSQIVAIELERVLPRIREIFERDDLFYKLLRDGKAMSIYSDNKLTVPFTITRRSKDDVTIE